MDKDTEPQKSSLLPKVTLARDPRTRAPTLSAGTGAGLEGYVGFGKKARARKTEAWETELTVDASVVDGNGQDLGGGLHVSQLGQREGLCLRDSYTRW